MSDVALAPVPLWRLFDVVGQPLAGGRLYVLYTRSATALVVYKDAALTTPWPTPIILDSAGQVPGAIYQPPDTLARYQLNNAHDNGTLWIADDITPVIGSVIALDHWLPFTPTWLNTGTPNSLLDGTLIGRYRYTGLTTIQFMVRLVFGVGTLSGNGVWLVGNLPGTVADGAPGFPVYAKPSAAGLYMGVANFQRPGAVVLYDGPPGFSAFNADRPFHWAAADAFRISGSYQVTPPLQAAFAFQGPLFRGTWGSGPEEG